MGTTLVRRPVGRARRRRARCPHRRLPALRLDRRRPRRCASGSRARRHAAGSTSSRTGPATSGRGGATPTRSPGVVTGSHLDSVPDGGAYDGPLGVVSAFAALDALRERGFRPGRPLGVVDFVDEEGARFGVACAGSRVITGALDADRALAPDRRRRRSTLAEALRPQRPTPRGPRPRPGDAADGSGQLRRAARRAGSGPGRPGSTPVAVGTATSGRTAAGGSTSPARPTTPAPPRLADRHDALLAAAGLVLEARAGGRAARLPRHRRQARRRARRGQRGPVPRHRLARRARRRRGRPSPRRSTRSRRGGRAGRGGAAAGVLDPADPLRPAPRRPAQRRSSTGRPVLGTGAGHDAGILANAGVPTGMLFVRNPTGVSHAPAEHADRDDCLAGVDALTTVLADLAGHAVTSPGPSGRRTPGCPNGCRADVRWSDRRRRLRERHAQAAVPQPGGRAPRRRRAARSGQRPQPRLPPRPARAHARRRRHVLDLARTDVRGRVPARPGPLPRRSPGRSTPRWRWPATPASASSTTCTTTRTAGRTPTRTRWVQRCSQAAAEAGLRITLLDTCYLAGGLTGDGHAAARPGAAPVLRRRRGGVAHPYGPARARARARRRGSARPRTRCAPCPREHWPSWPRPPPNGRCTSTSASSRPRTPRPQAFYGRTPDRAARRAGPARSPRTTVVHATHLTDADVERLGASGTAACFCPTTERDLADGIGPARRLRDGGQPADPRARTGTRSSTRSRSCAAWRWTNG